MALERCRFFSRACGAAIVVDYLSPRPGLSYIDGERPGLPGLGFLLAGSGAVMACYRACKKCLVRSRTSGSCGVSREWAKACRETLFYGNTSAGSMLLLVFQAAALGYSLATRGSDGIGAVMGSLVELLGYEDELPSMFYRIYNWLSPSYLARIGYNGMPDIRNPLYEDQLPGPVEFACKAGLYDNVLGELCTGFQQSLGYAYPVLREALARGEGLRRAVASATVEVVNAYGDFLSKRKGRWVPGSSADIVVNATARLLYEAFVARTLIPL